MKQQGTARLALAVFAFGLSLSLSAVAVPQSPCAICDAIYQQCLQDDLLSDQKCTANHVACAKRGDGRQPCPL